VRPIWGKQIKADGFGRPIGHYHCFGALLAVFIAMPIRRLSRRLNRRLKAETLVEQLARFEIEAFETRRDEVGRLYRNLSRLHQ
jgi:two-component system sensor histidine kinase ChvG